MITQPPSPAQERAPRSAWMFLVAAIASEVTGSLSLKGALDRPALYLLVVTGFVFVAAAWHVALPGVPIGMWIFLAAARLLTLSGG